MSSFKQLPLIYRMANSVRPNLSAEDAAYVAVLRELRKYTATSLVEAALRILWADYPTKLDELQTAPWHILLLLKWAFRDPHVALRAGASVTAREFDILRQQVLNLVGSEYKRQKPQNIFLMMRAHLQQIDFQRAEGWGFLRWPALIARQPVSQPSHRQFISEIGMPPEHFMDLAFVLLAAAMNREASLAPNWLDPVRHFYGDSIDAMWRLVSRDFTSLREEMQQDRAQRLPLRQELYEFPHLKRFPFIRARDGSLHCWHPKVLARALEDIVHNKLSELQREYTEPFSRLFEQYVMELTRAMDSNAVLEDQYRALAGDSMPTVEAVIPCGDCNVMVEAKMSLFGDDVLLTDSVTQAHQKTKRIRDGIKQGWNVGKALRTASSPLPACAAAAQDFLLVVTSRELFIGDGEMLARLFRAGEFGYPDEGSRKNLPLCNVFVVSIENFERLSNAVNAGAVSLPVLMKEAVGRNRDPATAAILFDAFVGKYVSGWGLPDLLSRSRQEAESRIRQAFGEGWRFP
jgi:hypothetical protein